MGKDVKSSGHGLFCGNHPAYTCREPGMPRETSVSRTVSVVTYIQTSNITERNEKITIYGS
jgi:hypothetical protein